MIVSAIAASSSTVSPPQAGSSPATDIRSSSEGPDLTGLQFPWKLHELLSHESDHIISWIPSGKGFKIHQKKEFVEHIMPRYFASTKYKSFQRSLNLWGFEVIYQESQSGTICHKYFVRGQPDLCKCMTRLKIKGTGPSKRKRNPSSHSLFSSSQRGAAESVISTPPVNSAVGSSSPRRDSPGDDGGSTMISKNRPATSMRDLAVSALMQFKTEQIKPMDTNARLLASFVDGSVLPTSLVAQSINDASRPHGLLGREDIILSPGSLLSSIAPPQAPLDYNAMITTLATHQILAEHQQQVTNRSILKALLPSSSQSFARNSITMTPPAFLPWNANPHHGQQSQHISKCLHNTFF